MGLLREKIPPENEQAVSDLKWGKMQLDTEESIIDELGASEAEPGVS